MVLVGVVGLIGVVGSVGVVVFGGVVVGLGVGKVGLVGFDFGEVIGLLLMVVLQLVISVVVVSRVVIFCVMSDSCMCYFLEI